MTGWLTAQSLIAALVAMAFIAMAILRPRRAILAYAVLGATPPMLQLGAFSGRTISQGLVVAEVLATVLAAAWVFKRETSGRLLRAPFDKPLLVFLAIGVASLIASLLLPDPKVSERVTLTVSIGQLLLVVWPLAVYWAAAEFIATTAQLKWLQHAIVVLALAQLPLLFAPEAIDDYLAWAMTFGFFASPFALAMAFSTRSTALRLVLIAVTLAPLIRGVADGKAFLYGYVLVSSGTILWMRASRAIFAAGGVAAAVVLVVLFAGGEATLTNPFERLVQIERKQFSYGGRTGRGQIALETLAIWKDAPLLGVGPGNSYIYMLQRRQIGTPHNQYLNILVEFGILGLAAWCWFLATVFTTGLRIYRRTTDPTHRVFVLGWLGSFVGLAAGGLTGDYMVHSIRNGGLEMFSGYYLQWVLLGGLVAVGRLERRSAQLAGARSTSDLRPVAAPPTRRIVRGRQPSRVDASA